MTTTQTTMKVVSTNYFNGRQLNFYGSEQDPYFMARDVAEMIDYQKTTQGKYNTAKMLTMVDDDEKIKGIPNSHTLINSGTAVWFLTEQGLYEVLFQSRKPKAKEFKKWVKQVLKEIRLNGYYMTGKLVEPTSATQTTPKPETQSLFSADMTYIREKLNETIALTSLGEMAENLEQTLKIIRVLEG